MQDHHSHTSARSGRRKQDLAERFWNRVDHSAGDSACWGFTASLDHDRAGRFKYDGHTVGAHKVAFALSRGIPLEEVGTVRHTCNTPVSPRCCNPSHLTNEPELEIQKADVDTSNTDPQYWEKRLRAENLGMARGLPQRGTTSSYGLDPQANQSDENPLPKRGIKKGALDASKDAFNTLLADADAQIAALPRPPVAPAPPPPQDAELPWRGSFYENRVRKVGGKRP